MRACGSLDDGATGKESVWSRTTMTQFVANSAKSVGAIISTATQMFRRVAHFPEALADVIEKIAVGK